MTSEVLTTGSYRCCVIHPEMRGLVRWRAMPGGGRQHGAAAVRAGARDRGGGPRHADLLVLGPVLTMDPQRPAAAAMAVTGGRVLALGSRTELGGLRGPGTEILDLGDRVALPGLVEPHMHLWSTVLFDAWIDCSPIANPTFEAVVERLGQAAAAAAPGEWVTGKLFDPSLYPGEPDLTAAILDRVAPSNPVLVANASMHFLYAEPGGAGARARHRADAGPAGRPVPAGRTGRSPASSPRCPR